LPFTCRYFYFLRFVLPHACYTFFFYLSCDLRTLHSFPTRRSSDLRVAGIRTVHPHHYYTAVSFNLKKLLHGCHPYSEIGRHPWRDRKSTRLNSSHVKISYAVFCLKKKKNNYVDQLPHFAYLNSNQT